MKTTRIFTRILLGLTALLGVASLRAQTIQYVEADGAPEVNVYRVIVPNGSLTDTGGATASLSFSGVDTPMAWEGAWSAGTDYALGDGVSHEGASYYASGDPTTGDEPGVDSDWSLLADQGDPGTPGSDGADAYVYIAYASADDGTDFTTTFNASLDYIAILSTDTVIETPAAGDFAGLWKSRVGAAGPTGSTGPGYGGTSTATLTPALGTVSLTTQTGLAYVTGSRVRITDTGESDNCAEGVVTTYTTGTGALEFTADKVGLALAEASSWTVSIIGEPGVPGLFYNHGNAGTAETIDVQRAQWHRIVLDQASCELTLANARPAPYINAVQVDFAADADGGGGVTYATGSDPEGTNPTISTTANAVTTVWFVSNDGGTTWRALTTTVSATDTAALHLDTAAEIVAVAEKTTLAANDEIILEDSADTNAKKSAKLSAVRAYIKSGSPHVFSLTIDNVADSMDYGIGYVPAAFTITEMIFVHAGTGPSSPGIGVIVRQGTDRSATGTAVVTAGTTVTSSTTGNVVTSFDDATCPADSFLWIETSSRSGTTDNLEVFIVGTFD